MEFSAITCHTDTAVIGTIVKLQEINFGDVVSGSVT